MTQQAGPKIRRMKGTLWKQNKREYLKNVRDVIVVRISRSADLLRISYSVVSISAERPVI
jgi:hypothetical protein